MLDRPTEGPGEAATRAKYWPLTSVMHGKVDSTRRPSDVRITEAVLNSKRRAATDDGIKYRPVGPSSVFNKFCPMLTILTLYLQTVLANGHSIHVLDVAVARCSYKCLCTGEWMAFLITKINKRLRLK